MPSYSVSGLLAATAITITSACEIPPRVVPETITEPFGIQVQNPDFPIIHNRYMYLYESGGGDEHLYLNPAGAPAFDLVLNEGVIEQGILKAVINGEYTESDNTTKLFMTERGDPRAFFLPLYGCNPDTDELQIELPLGRREGDTPGGNICVRSASGERHEFRWSPPGNPTDDPDRPCMPVTMVLVQGDDIPPIPTVTSGPEPTGTPSAFADVTEEGFAFVGCAPQERNADDDLGRTLDGPLFADDSMTNEACVGFCREGGFRFAGTEYRRECWCGNTLPPTRQPNTTVESLAGCSLTCMGDRTQYCGGAAWLSLYEACDEDEVCVNAEFTE